MKWERGTAAYKRTKLRLPDDLPEETVEEIQQTAIQACRALEVRDYARVDLRLKPDGTWYTLEVNPNPWLHSSAEFVLAAKQSGRDQVGLIEEIALMALARRRRRAVRPY